MILVFTAKQIEEWSKMPKKTLWRWLEKLEKARRVQSVSDMTLIKIDDKNGRGHETKLYNLNVLNQLAMVCIDNEKLSQNLLTYGRLKAYKRKKADGLHILPASGHPEWFRMTNKPLHNRRNTMQNTTLDSTISNSLQLFADKGFKIRVIMRLGEPWFVAKDVATCLEYSNVTKMCELCHDKDKVTITGSKEIRLINESLVNQQTLSRNTPNVVLISEHGLYRIFAKCRLPKCEPFESWVFDEVLPSIRKTGKYEAHPTVPSYMLASEEERAIAWAEEHRQARLALEAKEREIKSLQAQKDVMRQEYKSNKDFCNELIAKGVAVQKNGKPYALSTLRSRMSPILQEVSHTYRYSISEETVVVDGVERKTPYYHRDVCDMIAAVVTPQWLAKPTSDSITPLV